MKRIGIIGAGITGLSIAWYLQKIYPNAQVILFEKTNRAGGMIATMQEEFFFEKGPRTFDLGRCKHLISLINELGLDKEIILSNRDAHKRYIYTNNKLYSIYRKIHLASAICHDLTANSCLEEDESVASFFNRRLGKKNTANIIDPFVTGIYAADIHRLSMKSAFPSLFEAEKKYGSLLKAFVKKEKTKGKKGLFTLKNGLCSLIEALSKQFPIMFDSDVRINRCSNQVIIINKGQEFCFDHLFVTCPLSEVKQLFPQVQNYDELCYVPIVSVNVGYHEAKLSKIGFGYLVPSHEKEDILGIIFDSCVFPLQSRDKLRLTVLLGGANKMDILHASDEEITRIVAKTLKRHLNLPMPDYLCINRYPRAIPQYPLGHDKKINKWLEAAKEEYSSVTFVSNFIKNPSVNGRIQEAKYAVDALQRLSHIVL
ncbi:MAG: protoporphyrinogen oxidase [Chlamydiales bacterium]|nr:protoporphyrinogen oxidase [Chlamydiales bacterium]